MFHLKPKPRPPSWTGCETFGQDVEFLCHGDDTGMGAVDLAIGRLEEFDRVQVLAAALAVGHPLAFLAGIVEVEHGGDRIHAQPVDVVAFGPEEGIVDEIGADLAAAEIVDRRVPVGVVALPRIGMLVESRAVEAGEAVLVGGEMSRNPVEQHADARAVRRIDETGEAFRFAEARGRRIETGGLVAPGGIERVLADRQELDMGVAHVEAVGDQLLRHLVPGEEAAVLAASPRTGMHLVDRDRLVAEIRLAPEIAVRMVAPFVDQRPERDRGRRRPQFGAEGEGVGLQRQAVPVCADDLVLVGAASGYVGYEDFPDAGVAPQPHDVPAAVPVVEVADHRDATGVRRPDGEVDAADALVLDDVGAHLVEKPAVRALGDVVVVHRTEHRPEGIGVRHPPVAAGVGGVEPERLALADLQLAFEQPVLVASGQLAGFPAGEREGGDGLGMRNEAAGDQPALRALLYAEYSEGIAVGARDERRDLAGRKSVARRFLVGLGARRFHPALQISLAYSRIDLSEENHPTWAVLRIVLAYHAALSRKSASTPRCAFA